MPGVPFTSWGFMMYSLTLCPSCEIIFSTVLTPDMSTRVLFWSAVRISCGLGWGSSQNGLLSLFNSARKDLICGSIRESLAASGAADATSVIIIIPPMMTAIRRPKRFCGSVFSFIGLVFILLSLCLPCGNLSTRRPVLLELFAGKYEQERRAKVKFGQA